jgi:hypothetical protein
MSLSQTKFQATKNRDDLKKDCVNQPGEKEYFNLLFGLRDFLKSNALSWILMVLTFSCTNSNNEKPGKQSRQADTIVSNYALPETSSSLPPSVIYQDWVMGKPANAELVLKAYKVWDSATLQELIPYLADTIGLDLPDGRRLRVIKNSIHTTLGKWRKEYRETTNTPFSLISLYNKDMDQEWVIAWIWNRWRYNDGVRDSMLYCDNWRIKNNKIEYLNSAENKPSKQLRRKLNTIPE